MFRIRYRFPEIKHLKIQLKELTIINNKVFVFTMEGGGLYIDDNTPKEIHEFDLYLYDVIWEIDFSLHIKVEILYQNAKNLVKYYPIDET